MHILFHVDDLYLGSFLLAEHDARLQFLHILFIQGQWHFELTVGRSFFVESDHPFAKINAHFNDVSLAESKLS